MSAAQHILTPRDPEVEFVTVTPDMAAGLIQGAEEAGFTNRKVSDPTVDMYARDMKHGKWNQALSVILLSPAGHMIDGQHRCWACIKSDTPFRTMISRVLDEKDAATRVDGGRRRRAHDRLKMNDFEKYATATAAAIRMRMHQLETGYMFDSALISDADVLEFAEDNRKLIHRIHTMIPGPSQPLTNSRSILLMLCARNPNTAADFCHNVAYGYHRDESGLAKRDPAFVLRERLSAHRAAKRTSAKSLVLDPRQETYIVCTTYQRWLKGDKMNKIQLPKLVHNGEPRKFRDVYKIAKSL